jgi:hypothetical protein
MTADKRLSSSRAGLKPAELAALDMEIRLSHPASMAMSAARLVVHVAALPWRRAFAATASVLDNFRAYDLLSIGERADEIIGPVHSR